MLVSLSEAWTSSAAFDKHHVTCHMFLRFSDRRPMRSLRRSWPKKKKGEFVLQEEFQRF